MVRLQTAMGAERVRRSSHATCAVRSYMAARHSPLQQVSSLSLAHSSCFSDFDYYGSTFDLDIYIYRSGTACCRKKKTLESSGHTFNITLPADTRMQIAVGIEAFCARGSSSNIA